MNHLGYKIIVRVIHEPTGLVTLKRVARVPLSAQQAYHFTEQGFVLLTSIQT